jgi:hypothetical protein
MLSLADIKAGLTGAIRLFRADPRAMQAFDVSIDGFWKSFLAVVVILPLYLVYLHGEWSGLATRVVDAGEAPSFAGFLVVRLFILAIDWLAYPLIVLAAARPLGISKRVVPYVIAQNWASVVASTIIVIPGIAYSAGVVSDSLAVAGTLLMILVALRYFFVVARIALGAPVGLAIGLVAFNTVLSLLISELAARLA